MELDEAKKLLMSGNTAEHLATEARAVVAAAEAALPVLAAPTGIIAKLKGEAEAAFAEGDHFKAGDLDWLHEKLHDARGIIEGIEHKVSDELAAVLAHLRAVL